MTLTARFSAPEDAPAIEELCYGLYNQPIGAASRMCVQQHVEVLSCPLERVPPATTSAVRSHDSSNVAELRLGFLRLSLAQGWMVHVPAYMTCNSHTHACPHTCLLCALAVKPPWHA
eukprot:353588-Chlamydomonas_euryale.AAC.5